MRFAFWELYKIRKTHYIAAALLVMLAACCMITWFGIDSYTIESEDEISSYMKIYHSDPQGERAYMEKTIAAYEFAINNGDDFPPSIYTINDFILFKTKILPLIDFRERYEASLDRYIAVANGHLTEYDYAGYDKDSFIYVYQTKVIDTYEKLYGIDFPAENLVGWDEYFQSGAVPVFILLSALLFGSVIIPFDRQSGAMALVRSTKKGRLPTVAGKLGALFVLCVGAVLIFSFASLAVVYFRCGLTGWSFPVQMIDKFALSPYITTVGGAFALNLLVRLFAAFVFALIIAALSCFVKNQVQLYGAGLSILIVGFAVEKMNFLNAYNPIKQLNIMSSADGVKIFKAWQGIKLFNRCYSYVAALLIVYIIIAVAAIAACLVLFPKLSPQVEQSGKWLVKLHLPEFHMRRRYRAAIFPHEAKKLFGLPLIIILCLFTAFGLYLTSEKFVPDESYYEKLYIEYMQELRGEYTEKKAEFIDGQYNAVMSIVGKYEEMEDKYAAGAISDEDYRSYLMMYNKANPKVPVLERIMENKRYIEEKQSEGINAMFIYDSGWNRLLQSSFIFLPCLAIILALADFYALEYRNGISAVIRACKKGRLSVFIRKLTLAVLLSAVVSLSYMAMLTLGAQTKIGLPDAGFCAASLQLLSGYGSVSLLGFMLLYTLRVTLILCAVGITCLMLSRITKKNLAVLMIMTAVIFLPEALKLFGVTFLEPVSLLNLLGAV